MLRTNKNLQYTNFTSCPEIGGVQLLHAAYKKYQFSPHYHEGHVIGVIEKGCLGFDYRGEKVAAGSGDINIADPGEVHNGFCVNDSGWQYRMFYFAPGQLDEIADDVADRKTAAPFFKKGVIRDPSFAEQICRLHSDIENSSITQLEKESRFRLLFSSFIIRHAKSDISAVQPGSENSAVKRVKAYIRQHYSKSICLSDLSCEAGLSSYYLLRVFAKQTGMTPHAYLNHVRVLKARQLIENNVSIVDTALLVGFYDQSHLNRVFKKITGITPGQYFNAVQ